MSLTLVVISGFVGILCAVFWIWALVDCLLRPEDSYEKMFGTLSPKLVWALIIFFGQLIGAIIYEFVAGTRKNPKRASVKVDSAGTEEGKRILQMIADGKVTPEEGQRLLVALGENETKKTALQPTTMSMALKIGRGILIVALFMYALAVIVGFIFVILAGLAQ